MKVSDNTPQLGDCVIEVIRQGHGPAAVVRRYHGIVDKVGKRGFLVAFDHDPRNPLWVQRGKLWFSDGNGGLTKQRPVRPEEPKPRPAPQAPAAPQGTAEAPAGPVAPPPAPVEPPQGPAVAPEVVTSGAPDGAALAALESSGADPLAAWLALGRELVAREKRAVAAARARLADRERQLAEARALVEEEERAVEAARADVAAAESKAAAMGRRIGEE